MIGILVKKLLQTKFNAIQYLHMSVIRHKSMQPSTLH